MRHLQTFPAQFQLKLGESLASSARENRVVGVESKACFPNLGRPNKERDGLVNWRHRSYQKHGKTGCFFWTRSMTPGSIQLALSSTHVCPLPISLPLPFEKVSCWNKTKLGKGEKQKQKRKGLNNRNSVLAPQ